MSIRILAGCRRGALLAAPPGESTRPLLTRVRQALFDVLGERTPDSRVLDLFAGSGAVGIEALSRGARWATFVDQGPAAIETIRRNLAKVRFEDRARTVRATLPGAIEALPVPPDMERYDLVFVMPPFGEALLGPALERLAAARDLIAPGACIVGQLERNEPVPTLPPSASLALVEERLYGVNRLLFWLARKGKPR